MIRWYDYLVIGFVSDVLAATVFGVLSGNLYTMLTFPLLTMMWLHYEKLRKEMENDKRSE